MLKVAVGHSCDPDSQSAIEEVLEQCAASLEGMIAKAGILFADIEFDHALILRQINQAFPGIQLIGGTSDGEMSSLLGFQQDSMTLMLFSSDTIEICAGVGRNLSQNAVAAVSQALTVAREGITGTPKLCITLPEGLTGCTTDILLSLKQGLGSHVPIFGGLTADHYKFQQTYQFFQTEVLSDTVPILLFAGDVLVSSGVAGGWQAIGEKGKVTKVDRNVVHEIDGQPACNFYQNYLKEVTPEWGMAVFEGDEDHFYMRSLNNEYGSDSLSLTFFGDIPEGAIVQLTVANRKDILTAAKDSMMQAYANYPGTEPAAALFFSCTCRRIFLGPEISTEYEIIRDCLPISMPNCGFYAYGEIGSTEVNKESLFHNQTLIVLLLGTK